MKRIFCFILISCCLTGCLSWPRIPTPKTPKAAQKSMNWEETSETKPIVIELEEGKKAVVVNETRKTFKAGFSKIIPKKTFGQKIGAWIGGLGTLAIIAIIAGLILAPGATLGLLVKTLFKWKRAARETAKAIKTYNNQNGENKVLHDTLKMHQSEGTKRLIGNIKHNL